MLVGIVGWSLATRVGGTGYDLPLAVLLKASVEGGDSLADRVGCGTDLLSRERSHGPEGTGYGLHVTSEKRFREDEGWLTE